MSESRSENHNVILEILEQHSGLLKEISTQVKATNGRVNVHDQQFYGFKIGVAVAGTLLTFVILPLVIYFSINLISRVERIEEVFRRNQVVFEDN